MRRTPTFTVSLPEELRKRLEARAASERMPLSVFIRRALWDVVEPVPAPVSAEVEEKREAVA